MSQLSKIFTFDLDGNLFNTPTSFYFEKRQEDGIWERVEIEAYKIDENPDLYHNSEHYRFLGNDPEKTFQNFRDYFDDPNHRGPDGLMIDIKKSIEENLHAPSLNVFKKALIDGQLFAILTARGHTPDNLKRISKLTNKELLNTDEKKQQIINIKNNFGLKTTRQTKYNDKDVLEKYFDYNGYLPVNNIEWCKTADIDFDLSSKEKKTLAMNKFLKYIKNLLIKIKKQGLFETLSCGFSDDSSDNIKSMLSYFLKISHEKKYLNNYNIYYTGKQNKYEEIVEYLGEEREKYVFLNLPKIKKDPKQQLLKISIKS